MIIAEMPHANDHVRRVAGTFTITWPHLFRATTACNIVRVAQHPVAFS